MTGKTILNCSWFEGDRPVTWLLVTWLLNGPDLKRYQEIYFAAWPECEPHMNWPGIAYFVVRPRWIRYSDYDQKPPIIEEVAISS